MIILENFQESGGSGTLCGQCSSVEKGYTAKVCKNLEHKGDVLCHILSAKKTWHKADGVCQISESVSMPQVHVMGANVVHHGVKF